MSKESLEMILLSLLVILFSLFIIIMAAIAIVPDTPISEETVNESKEIRSYNAR